MPKKLKYKRVLLKLSGEVFAGDREDQAFDIDVCKAICREVIDLVKMGAQVAIVVGGGNIWRYRDNKSLPIDHVDSDNMGMLATMMNVIFLKNVFNFLKLKKVAAFAANAHERILAPYTVCRARKKLEEGNVVLLGGGTGNPFFTTDSASALRALELECDVFLKATKVDYVYDKDPMKYKDAQKFKKVTYNEVLKRELGVMDLAAVSLCMESSLPIEVFNLQKKGNICKVVAGQSVGTLVTN